MNQRRTQQLEETYRVLCVQQDHPTAEQVFKRVRRRIPSVSLGTVYRNLEKLRVRGEIRVVRVRDEAARYDAVTDEHDHFVCDNCGAVLDIRLDRSEAHIRALQRDGYKVRSQS